MLRLWRGEWKKTESNYWRFVPTTNDQGLSVYVQDGVDMEAVEMLVKTRYGVSRKTPVVFTYGLPDWMVIPSGHTPPLTVASTSDLVGLMESRPWMIEFTLFVTVGARGVAEYHFNRRSTFSIGSTSFVVDESQDATSRGAYERKF